MQRRYFSQCVWAGVVSLAFVAAAGAQPTPAAAAPAQEKDVAKSAQSAPRVALEIVQDGKPMGTIVIELNAEKAPITTKNFLAYVDSGYFNGTIFHRIIPDFMIQGGGYTPDFKEKTQGLLPPIVNEASNGLHNERGTIAMARTNAPNSATSQFFINVVDNSKKLDANANPGNPVGYCVFGKVVEGMDVVDKIKALPTKPDPRIGNQPAPLNPPVIQKAARVEAKAGAPENKPAGEKAAGGEKKPEPKPAEGEKK